MSRVNTPYLLLRGGDAIPPLAIVRMSDYGVLCQPIPKWALSWGKAEHMGAEGWSGTQVSMSRNSNWRNNDIKHYTAQEISARTLQKLKRDAEAEAMRLVPPSTAAVMD